MATKRLTNHADIFSDTNASNTIFGLAGNDTIFGNGGNDVIFGGRGNDKLFGGSGNDKVFGGSGDDKLFGGTGNDTLEGGDGADTLVGGNGNDRLYAGHALLGSLDNLFGGAGDDWLVGGSQGGSGPVDGYENLGPYGPELGIGGSPEDGAIMNGGTGADTFVFNGGEIGIQDFEAGTDKIDLSVGHYTIEDLTIIDLAPEVGSGYEILINGFSAVFVHGQPFHLDLARDVIL